MLNVTIFDDNGHLMQGIKVLRLSYEIISFIQALKAIEKQQNNDLINVFDFKNVTLFSVFIL